MLLVLKKLFPESALTGLLPEIVPSGQGEIRQAEGFEAQRGDLVLELAKVLSLTKKIMMIKVMTMNVMVRLMMMNVIMMNVMTTFEVVALPPLVGTNMGCKPPDLQRRLILTLMIVAMLVMRIAGKTLLMMYQLGQFVRIQDLLGSFWRLRGRSSSSCLLVSRWPRMRLPFDGRLKMY